MTKTSEICKTSEVFLLPDFPVTIPLSPGTYYCAHNIAGDASPLYEHSQPFVHGRLKSRASRPL